MYIGVFRISDFNKYSVLLEQPAESALHQIFHLHHELAEE